MTDQVNEAVAWMLRKSDTGFVRSIYPAAPTDESRKIAEIDGDEYVPLYTHPSRGVVDVAMVKRCDLAWSACGPDTSREEVVRRILQAAALPAVPEGMALVPERMHLSVEALEVLSIQCGGVDPESIDIEERWCSGTLWVGDILDDDGKPTHGLHLSNDECPEEGSVTLVEFAATLAQDPQPAVPSVPVGMALVPREPTPGMRIQGAVALAKEGNTDACGADADACYRAMLAATAKDQPAQGEG